MKLKIFILVVIFSMLVACTTTHQDKNRVFTDTEHANFYVSDEDTIAGQNDHAGYSSCCGNRVCICSPRFRKRDTGAPDSYQDWRDRD